MPTIIDSIYSDVLLSRIGTHGWCSTDKAKALAKCVYETKSQTCVEIGVFGGMSVLPQAIAIRQLHRDAGSGPTAGKVYGIDPWTKAAALENMTDAPNIEWWSKVDLEMIYKSCQNRVKETGVERYVELIRAKGREAAARFGDQTVDLLHIDGNHSSPLALLDAQLYLPKVRYGGTIFFDDVGWIEGGQVATHASLQHLLQHGCLIVDHKEDWMILTKSK